MFVSCVAKKCVDSIMYRFAVKKYQGSLTPNFGSLVTPIYSTWWW